MNPPAVLFYEVYDKRALHEPLAGLPLLDRDRDIKEALKSARAWGGVIFQIQARVLQQYPLIREIIVAELKFIHTPRPTRAEPRDRIGLRELKGKLRQARHRNLYRGRR